MELFHGLSALTWQQVVMVGVGLLLIYLAAVKEYEPSLLPWIKRLCAVPAPFLWR